MTTPKKVTRYRVRLRKPDVGSVLLDMLRYEGARVVDWTYEADGYRVTLETERLRHAPDRWLSFGIRAEPVI